MIFATLRWTKSSPGSSPTISLAGTRLSEQPIHRKSGDCWRASFGKKSGSFSWICLDQFRLFLSRSSMVLLWGIGWLSRNFLRRHGHLDHQVKIGLPIKSKLNAAFAR